MNAAIFAFTERGKALALRIKGILAADFEEVRVIVPERLADDDCAAYTGGLSEFTGALFDRDALLFVGACGIAVRAVAPHASDKRSDPAVLCVDERRQYVIPLLSGHIGGANRLAKALAAALGAVPVITTATDINGRFSADAWAAECGLYISDMALAKRVSAEILTRDIPFYSDHAAPDMPLPNGLVWAESGELGVCVSARDIRPFSDTLLLVPKALRVGIGCRRGAAKEAVDALIGRVFRENRLRIEAVAGAATIDVKSDEPGLIECCRGRGWPVAFHTAEQLAAVPGDFTSSKFVESAVGVGNVCERAAAAEGGRIIVPKTAENGVTIAVAEMKWGIDFG